MLRGRQSEIRTLDVLIERVHEGGSGALVMWGPLGVGKSALLDHGRERAAALDCRVLGAAGVSSETGLAFSGLHQLCAPLLDRLEHLPAPQRDALATAFALRRGEEPAPFVVDVAVLSLLSDAAKDRPLVCLVDDAQWLDRASLRTLAFVARRLAAPIALLFAAPELNGELAGLPELAVQALREADARALLCSALRAPLDERVRDRIVAEARGNPSTLLEVARIATAADLAGGFATPDTPPPLPYVEDDVRQRLEALPADTRRLLLIAAAEPVGAPAVLRRAAERLDIAVDAAAVPAAAAGMLDLGVHVRFAHPLARSAVYRAASPPERRAVHQALADVIDEDEASDRRAWHRALAARGVDEAAALALEQSVECARARGGLPAAAAFRAYAARLTPGGPRRAARALEAAQTKYEAGATDAALQLLATAQAGPLDELQRARVDALRAHILALSHGSDAPPLLLGAARRLAPLRSRLARDAHLELLTAALLAGPLAGGGGALEAARIARAGAPSPQPSSARDLLLDGVATLIIDGPEAAAPRLGQALSALRADDLPPNGAIAWLWLACYAAAQLFDDESWHVLADRFTRLARDSGALAALPLALNARAAILQCSGDSGGAAALIDELDAVAPATGNRLAPYGALVSLAWQGREEEAAELIAAIEPEVRQRGEGAALALVDWARALLHNARGRYADVLTAAQYPPALPFANWCAIEQIEAAAHTGQLYHAAAALERISATARASGTDWACGVHARSRALVSTPEVAEALHQEAIERLARTRIRTELARAHLVYGEWLRHQHRRAEAREQLGRARELFIAAGACAFAERAARELQPAGRHTPAEDLTARETQIAQLARDGLSNAEIGARMYISPRTVEYHLTKIFAKLDLSSRTQLRLVLPARRDSSLAAAE